MPVIVPMENYKPQLPFARLLSDGCTVDKIPINRSPSYGHCLKNAWDFLGKKYSGRWICSQGSVAFVFPMQCLYDVMVSPDYLFQLA